jgi:hypothetical protein
MLDPKDLTQGFVPVEPLFQRQKLKMPKTKEPIPSDRP